MKIRFYLGALVAILLASCQSATRQLTPETYRAVFDAQDQQEIPFLFKVKSATSLEIYNGDEVIVVDEISYSNDSVTIQLPVFDSFIKARIDAGGRLEGYYSKPGASYKVPFRAVVGDHRFTVAAEPTVDITGDWQVLFGKDSTDQTSWAKGSFEQDGSRVTGTFRTPTGDYRFLEGVMDGNQLKLSAFDGVHLFLFTATVADSSLNGTFYSKNSWKESFSGVRNERFELPDPESLTTLKEGYESISFSFPDEHGALVSLSDEQFKDKVVVVQIMGSWCPNCLDETRYFASYARTHANQPLAFVGLAFEYAKTDSACFAAIARLKQNVGVDYPILLAMNGTENRKEASAKIPGLSRIMSYPTSIIIDKQGHVRRIHTGFDGPATGDKYTAYQTRFDHFIQKLMAE
ncbi:TlpA disulfide reductase family protein [Mangrovibacterium marinum]|uniref:Thiol-disulfide isomerase/thioredoxin n=1 Tax=Mangrovibacterium marinum TaxID=1639118 RepID=A0A2T5C473_9BACT|nr:TlpA disulfide reductase family protein [Mangrovibacterium marinum]PTN09568.1 thiol-disulfide isomerase/thioredoxin [Mangrovibacterium marinum]